LYDHEYFIVKNYEHRNMVQTLKRPTTPSSSFSGAVAAVQLLPELWMMLPK
jgi:hypothetical protein